MGWNLLLIALDPAPKIKNEGLLNVFEKGTYEIAGSTELKYTPMVGNGAYCLGKYMDKQIIINEESVFDLFKVGDNSLESRLTKEFPNTRIFACFLVSAVNGWGYLFKESLTKRRRRAGSFDEGLLMDEGHPLKEEQELFDYSRLNDRGQRIYYFNELSKTGYTEDQVGEEFVFKLLKRFFEGSDFGTLEFNEVKLTTFRRIKE